MINLEPKIILVDVDGVLLEWHNSYVKWLMNYGCRVQNDRAPDIGHRFGLTPNQDEELTMLFNQTVWLNYLPPTHDALPFVTKLHRDHHYNFKAITAAGTDHYVAKSRRQYLNKIFGDSIISVEFTNSVIEKEKYLREYKDSRIPWVEDNIIGTKLGKDLGLTTFFMNHDYNKHMAHQWKTHEKGLTYYYDYGVSSWKEIYNFIMKEEQNDNSKAA